MSNVLTDDPLASETLAVSQGKMRANNLYYGNTLNVDHQIGPANGTRNDGITAEGYHKVIHFVTNGGNPGPVTGIGQLFTKTVGSDQQIFFESGGGIITQITGPNAPLISGNGYTWLPGGLLMQWGIAPGISSSGSGTTVSFTSIGSLINFPNNCFLVLANGNSATGSVSTNTFTTSTFVAKASNSTISINFIALGN